jgi:hypothetical protein
MRSRRGGRIFRVATTLGLALWAAPAAAWNFAEHRELGRDGYEAACVHVAHDHSIDDQHVACEKATDPKIVRWCLACKAFSPELYGQSVAIAGDHVATPEQLMSVAGERTATDLTAYAFLALVNVEHFHPDSPRHWREYHDRALGFATGQTDGPGLAQDFARAFYTSAFADHFLQDAFAAGHAGFNRVSSSAAASKAFHDIWNGTGRLVKAPSDQCWITFGDNKLHAGSSKEHVDEAEVASAYDVIAAFVARQRDAARELKPIYFMPSAMNQNALPGAVSATEGRADGSELPLQSTQTINRIFYEQKGKIGACAKETVPIDGMSNPAELSSGIDYWGRTNFDGGGFLVAVDVVGNHLGKQVPLSVEGGLSPVGIDHWGGKTTFAPGALAGVFTPPLYLLHGLWRNELGGQWTARVRVGNGGGWATYGTVALRSSLEVASFIVRVQVGPSWDPRTERVGVAGSLGVELEGLRWVRGGGTLGN